MKKRRHTTAYLPLPNDGALDTGGVPYTPSPPQDNPFFDWEEEQRYHAQKRWGKQKLERDSDITELLGTSRRGSYSASEQGEGTFRHSETDPSAAEPAHAIFNVKAGIGSRVMTPIRWVGRKAKFVKHIDGFDEMAVAMQGINELIGDIAGVGVNAGALPFVILGAIGLIHESLEASEDLEKLRHERKVTLNDICDIIEKYNLQNSSSPEENLDKTPKTKAAKKQGKNARKLSKTFLKEQNPDEETVCRLTLLMAQLAAQDSDIFGKRIDKWNHFLGAEAMVGMAWGVGANIINNFAGIVHTAIDGGSVVTEVIMEAAEFGAMGCLVPANAAMSIFGAVKCGNGIRKEIKHGLAKKRIRQQLDGYVSPEAMQYSRQYLSTDQKFIGVDDLGCGAATSLGQGLMVAGAVLNVTGYGGPAGMACSLAGGGITISAAVTGAVTKHKHEQLHGHESKVNPEHRRNYSKLRTEALMEAGDASEIYPTLAKKAGRDMEESTKNLARTKLHSLLFHVINSKHFDKENKADVHNHMEKLLRTGRKNIIFKRTSLTKDVKKCMQDIYREESYDEILNCKTHKQAVNAFCEKIIEHEIDKCQKRLEEEQQKIGKCQQRIASGITPERIKEEQLKIAFSNKVIHTLENKITLYEEKGFHGYTRKGLKDGKHEKAFARELYRRTRDLIRHTNIESQIIFKEGKHWRFNLDAYEVLMQGEGDLQERLRYEYEKLALGTMLGKKKNAAKVHRGDAVENMKTVANAFRIHRKRGYDISPPLDTSWTEAASFGNNPPRPNPDSRPPSFYSKGMDSYSDGRNSLQDAIAALGTPSVYPQGEPLSMEQRTPAYPVWAHTQTPLPVPAPTELFPIGGYVRRVEQQRQVSGTFAKQTHEVDFTAALEAFEEGNVSNVPPKPSSYRDSCRRALPQGGNVARLRESFEGTRIMGIVH